MVVALSGDRYPFGAHERIDWLCDVFMDSGLQTPTVAVFAADLIKHTNSQTGEAYPSISRIAKEYGMAREAISRGVKRLLEAKKIEVVLRPGRSTIYKLLLPVTGQSQQAPVTTQSQVSSEPVTVQSHPCDCTVTPPVTVQLHEPLSETGTIPVLRKDRGGTETLPGAVSAANGKDKYPDFWQAFPVRSTVADAEQMIAELVAASVPLHEIIEGARRYQKYNAATASKHRQSAKQWLARQAWRDDWTLPQKATKKENITRLRGDFDLAGSDRKALRDLSCRLEGKITGHLWGKGQEPEDAYSDSARELALCKLCYAYLYEDLGEPCDTMADIIEQQDGVDKRLMGEA